MPISDDDGAEPPRLYASPSVAWSAASCHVVQSDSGMSRARIQSASTASVTSPPAKATIICTTSTSVADNYFMLRPRNVIMVMNAVRLFPSLNGCARARPKA